MNKKVATRSIILLTLVVGAVTFVWFRFFYAPNYPRGSLSEGDIYLINPETILASLDQGDKDVFLPAPPEPDDGWPQLWPPGSFSWDQEDYLKIADAAHQFVWKEPLDDWHLIRARFRIDQCVKTIGRIDAASLSFQRQEDRNDVHGFFINPLYGYIDTGKEYYYPSEWASSSIYLDQAKIDSVDAALSVAEENGGREARSLVKNECRITLLLAPDRFEYDFLSHPFTRYGWGWEIFYWSNKSDRSPGPLFGIIIDPYTGNYEIPRWK